MQIFKRKFHKNRQNQTLSIYVAYEKAIVILHFPNTMWVKPGSINN